LSCFLDLLPLCSDEEEAPVYASTAPTISPAATEEPAEPVATMRTTRSAVRKVPQTQAHGTKRAKKAKGTDISLEAHASTVPSDDVSDSSLLASFSYSPSLTYFFPSGFDAEICRLGHGMCKLPKGCESFRR
jgi:hypothetical protein